jgi:hypothetical protein
MSNALKLLDGSNPKYDLSEVSVGLRVSCDANGSISMTILPRAKVAFPAADKKRIQIQVESSSKGIETSANKIKHHVESILKSSGDQRFLNAYEWWQKEQKKEKPDGHAEGNLKEALSTLRDAEAVLEHVERFVKIYRTAELVGVIVSEYVHADMAGRNGEMIERVRIDGCNTTSPKDVEGKE